jgi:hypothetical protein
MGLAVPATSEIASSKHRISGPSLFKLFDGHAIGGSSCPRVPYHYGAVLKTVDHDEVAKFVSIIS